MLEVTLWDGSIVCMCSNVFPSCQQATHFTISVSKGDM